LRPLQFICALALAFNQLSQAAAPKTPPSKKGPVNKPAASKSGIRPKATSGTRSRGTVATRSRKSSAPRQQSPSTERYLEIQQALAAKGYFKGEPNGAWGPDSVDALKRFQTDQKLQPDGKIGALSLIALGLGPKHEANGEIASKPQPPQENQ
jgi:peptidoglycan hydrolase-like protein with peptidoglycan-binding domain